MFTHSVTHTTAQVRVRNVLFVVSHNKYDRNPLGVTMSNSPTTIRSSIYRVTNEARQQRILRAIERVGDPAITAEAQTTDGEFLIVAKSSSATADVHVRRIVVSLDLNATRISTSERLYDESPPSSAYVGTLGFTRVALSSLRKIL
jgi:hypothetical protein